MTGVCKTTIVAAALVLATVVPASANKASEIDAALRTVFKSKDVDRNGVLDSAEITNFVNNLFAAMDTDGDRLVTQRAFSWAQPQPAAPRPQIRAHQAV